VLAKLSAPAAERIRTVRGWRLGLESYAIGAARAQFGLSLFYVAPHRFVTEPKVVCDPTPGAVVAQPAGAWRSPPQRNHPRHRRLGLDRHSAL
jgi:hypothetical protein